MMWIQNN